MVKVEVKVPVEDKEVVGQRQKERGETCGWTQQKHPAKNIYSQRDRQTDSPTARDHNKAQRKEGTLCQSEHIEQKNHTKIQEHKRRRFAT